MNKLESKNNVAKAEIDVHRVTQVEIRVEEYPKSKFQTVEFWVSTESQADMILLKCFCEHREFHVTKISDSLVERLITVRMVPRKRSEGEIRNSFDRGHGEGPGQ